MPLRRSVVMSESVDTAIKILAILSMGSMFSLSVVMIAVLWRSVVNQKESSLRQEEALRVIRQRIKEKRDGSADSEGK